MTKTNAEIEIARSLELLEVSEQRQITNIIELAAVICETSISAISFFDNENQKFLYSVGLSKDLVIPREEALCEFVISAQTPVIVPDAADNSPFGARAAKFGVKFYAGFPLIIAGAPVAVFCVIDKEPKILDQKQLKALDVLYKQLQFILDGQEIKKNIASLRADAAESDLQRRQAETSLVDSEARLAALTDNLPGAVFRFTVGQLRELKFTYLSSGLERIFEISREKLFEDVSLAFAATYPEDLIGLMDVLFLAIDEKRKFDWTGRVQTQSGEIKWVHYIAQPTVDLANGITAWDGIAFDVTERKTFEADLAEKRARVESSSKMASLGEMAAGLAHEINNAINYVGGSVPGLLRFIEKTPDSPEKIKAIRYLNAIKEGTRVTSEIIRNLRAYSRSESNNPESVNLSEVAGTILQILGPKIREKDIEMHLEIDHLHKLHGYRGALNQIFLNLISNAADALHVGGRVWVSSSETESEIKITVRDDGPGIPCSILNKIYEPFFTTKEIGKGTGLGLFMVHREVMRMQGSIDCRSEVGVGTTFEITLPQVALTTLAIAV